MTEQSISPDKKNYGYTLVEGKTELYLVIPFKERKGWNQNPINPPTYSKMSRQRGGTNIPVAVYLGLDYP